MRRWLAERGVRFVVTRAELDAVMASTPPAAEPDRAHAPATGGPYRTPAPRPEGDGAVGDVAASGEGVDELTPYWAAGWATWRRFWLTAAEGKVVGFRAAEAAELVARVDGYVLTRAANVEAWEAAAREAERWQFWAPEARRRASWAELIHRSCSVL